MSETNTEKSWDEFQQAGMLWFVNRILHVFGWVIILKYDEESVPTVYPARTKWRGFNPEIEAEGYKKVSKWMAEHGDDLETEANT
jgi:hypothetical protein